MEYRFGEWNFNAEHLCLHKKGCGEAELKRAYQVLEVKRNLQYVHEVLNRDDSRQNAAAGVWNPIGICLTYNCNMRCNYCSYSSEANGSTAVTMEMVKAFLNEAMKRYLISRRVKKNTRPLLLFLSGGGEPTCEWDRLKNIICLFEELCGTYAIEYYINMTTNGLLNDAQIGFLAQHVQEIMVSYDGMADLQNNNRPTAGGGLTDNIVENTISNLSSGNLKLVVRTTLWPENYKDMLAIYQHVRAVAKSEHAFIWSVNPVANEGRALERDSCTEKGFVENYIQMVNDVGRIYGEGSVKQIETPFLTNDYCRLYCGAINGQQPWLLPDGEVVACMESPNHKDIIARIENDRIYYYR